MRVLPECPIQEETFSLKPWEVVQADSAKTLTIATLATLATITNFAESIDLNAIADFT